MDRWNDNNSHLAGAPCLVISICYFYTLKAARVRIKRITKNEACSVNGDEAVAQLKKSKAVFTVGIVVGVFLVCWTSSLVISFVQFFCNDPCKRTKLNGYWFLGALFKFSNSAFNPFIYCKAPSTRIRIFLNPQLFLSGYGYRPHAYGEFASKSGNF